MTYNFDPDKWLDDELYMLAHQLKTGQINQDEHDSQAQTLEQRHEEMWQRLNGTYQVTPDRNETP